LEEEEEDERGEGRERSASVAVRLSRVRERLPSARVRCAGVTEDYVGLAVKSSLWRLFSLLMRTTWAVLGHMCSHQVTSVSFQCFV
jgi:hypothetical protein